MSLDELFAQFRTTMNRNDKIMCFSFLSFSLRDHVSKNPEKENQLPFGT